MCSHIYSEEKENFKMYIFISLFAFLFATKIQKFPVIINMAQLQGNKNIITSS